jgi:hypothetical protein
MNKRYRDKLHTLRLCRAMIADLDFWRGRRAAGYWPVLSPSGRGRI